LSGNHWVNNFTVSEDDIDHLVNLMLEREMPMTTEQLALTLIKARSEQEAALLKERYKDSVIYQPSVSYEVGTRVIFSEMGFATATVQEVRAGNNPDYGAFEVIAVEFDEDEHNTLNQYREFAANLAIDHQLNAAAANNPFLSQKEVKPEQILQESDGQIQRALSAALIENPVLERVAGYWFPSELVLDFDIGTLHLAEAVLDMAGGGPLRTEEIIEQIGGISDAPLQLQVFSLNLALNQDERFDEVGPAGEVLWFLNRMEPEPVRIVPQLLQYTPIEYDDDLLSDEMYDLETELDDEFTPIEFEGRLRRATSTLIYPHRRTGTLPLNAKNRAIFPTARTPRIHVELIDQSDRESFSAWVVHDHSYVYGLSDYYNKHHLPVGAFISVEQGDNPGQIHISHAAYKPRTEWIRILSPHNNQIRFENKKRAVGAEFDDFIIIGVDDIEAVDQLSRLYQNKSIAAILREVITELSKLSPQGTVHAITLYSTVNVVRRCAPGPIFATLTANPDFDDVGDHYWKLSE